MSNAAIDYLALKNELATDPQHYGYATITNDDQLAALFNQVNSSTLTTALTNGQTGITSLAVAALKFAVPGGSTLQLISGGSSQQVTVATGAGAAAGATSIPTVSFTAAAAFPTTTAVYPEPVTVKSISTAALQNAVVASDYTGLTSALQNLWLAIIVAGGGKIDVSLTGIRNQIGTIFGAGTTTRANLLALQTRAGSRAEALFGAGVIITGTDLVQARNS